MYHNLYIPYLYKIRKQNNFGDVIIARMEILGRSHLDDFKTPPYFTSVQRKSCLDFPNTVLSEAQKLRSSFNQIGFLLSYGYFKISKRFYAPEDFHPRDIVYVTKSLGFEENVFNPSSYMHRIRRNHQKIIVEMFGFQEFNPFYCKRLQTEITTMVRNHLKPKLIFWRCVDLLILDKIVFPTYRCIQDLIRSELAQHKFEMNALIERNMSTVCHEMLDSLLTPQKKNSDTKYGKYHLTLLKKRSQSTRPAKIKASVKDYQLLAELFEKIEPVLQKLNWGQEGIRYYATSVSKARTIDLLRRSDEDRYIHMIAFIAHQYCRLQDNLIDVLLATVKSTENMAQREYMEWCYEHRKTLNDKLSENINNLETKISGIFNKIKTLINDQFLSDAEKLKKIDSLVFSSSGPLSKSNAFDELREILPHKSEEDNHYYDILEQRSIRLQNRVGSILKTMNFLIEDNANPLMLAIKNFADKDGVITANTPLGFLNPQERYAIIKDGKFRISLYKVYLFQHVSKALKSGSLNLQHSHKYRPLNSYLISKERWKLEKKDLLKRADLEAFVDPLPILRELDQKLLQQFKITNMNIISGQNSYVKLKKNGDFIVHTPKQDDADDKVEPLAPFFPQRHYVPLSEILATVNFKTEFTNELQHWQQQYNRRKPVQPLLIGVVGLGCGIGTRKMARISNQVTEQELENTVNWHFSLENLRAANDCVIQHMDNMELPNLYRLSPNRLHTASDGQKFEVRPDSLNANYSFKYFGKGQGVSAYTFIDERNLLWHSLVFSASERESAYVIDGLMRNDVIKSDIHSTDTHGYSEVIFAASHLLGFSFAPRIKNLKKQALYIFKSNKSQDQKEWAIKPSKTINVQLIKDHWDDILRLIATIKLKEATASDMETIQKCGGFKLPKELAHFLVPFLGTI
jgi:hypothetical protein